MNVLIILAAVAVALVGIPILLGMFIHQGMGDDWEDNDPDIDWEDDVDDMLIIHELRSLFDRGDL